MFLGFQDFLIANNVVASKSEIPSRTMLSPIQLNKIYYVYVQQIKEQLKSAPPYPSMTCDIWSDKYKHRSFICFTIHFLDAIFQSHNYSLKTEPFDGPHTGEAIKQYMSNVIREFSLNINNIIMVRMKFS